MGGGRDMPLTAPRGGPRHLPPLSIRSFFGRMGWETICGFVSLVSGGGGCEFRSTHMCACARRYETRSSASWRRRCTRSATSSIAGQRVHPIPGSVQLTTQISRMEQTQAYCTIPPNSQGPTISRPSIRSIAFVHSRTQHAPSNQFQHCQSHSHKSIASRASPSRALQLRSRRRTSQTPCSTVPWLIVNAHPRARARAA
ncbi:hypothetical protein BDW22DRAFT_456201 [Trametopsis cervina]|nr:hypothetical protein BDW22DRAFT_456201 [Trametopsis cervina]